MQRSAAPSQVRRRIVVSAQKDENAAVESNDTSVPDATLVAKCSVSSSLSPVTQQQPAPFSKAPFSKQPFKSPFKTPFKSPVSASTGVSIPSEALTKTKTSQNAESTLRASPATLASYPLAISSHPDKSNKRRQETSDLVSKKQAKLSVPCLLQSGIPASLSPTYRATNAPALHPTTSFKIPPASTVPSNSVDSGERCLNVLW